MNSAAKSILDSVPDFSNWSEATSWFQEGRRIVRSLSGSLSLSEEQAEFISIHGSELGESKHEPFGLYSSPLWRKFTLATFLADWVSYSQPLDQVNFDRLLFVMHAFPQGFKTWWLKLPNGKAWPVGYTAWHPMFDAVFEHFEKSPETIRDRLVIPDVTPASGKSFLYLFNYSIAPALKKTNFSKLLLKSYAQEVRSIPSKGLACITVSDEGAKVAKQFGMSLSGHLKWGGTLEGIYTSRN